MAMLSNAQKAVISNVFRDLTKLIMVALVFGQFVPGQIFNLKVFSGGLVGAVLMGTIAIIFAVKDKEEDI